MKTPPPSTTSVGRTLLGFVALVLLVLVCYAPSIPGDFIWDDDANVTQNPTLRNTAGLARIWTDIHANQQFYPLIHTSFWIEYQMWELWASGYRITNLLLHALVAGLIWITLRRLSVPGAWVAAAIFALHPVQVETVAWITERKNLLSVLFYFAALLVYLRFAGLDGQGRAPYRRWSVYALSLLLFTAAMLSKTAVLTLPATLLVILWWKNGRLSWKDAGLVSPMLVIGAALGAVTASIEWGQVGAVGHEWQLGPLERIIVAGRAFWFYATHLVFPFRLNFIYPRWSVDAAAVWQFAFPVAALALTALLWRRREQIGRGPLAAILFFGITLSPALGFLDFYFQIYSFVQDHFQYLACAGLIALCTGLVTHGLKRVHERAGVVAAGLVLVVLGGLTWQRSSYFTSQEVLWTRTLERNPGAWMADINLGLVYAGAGRFDEAAERFRKALATEHVQHDKARYNLGWVLERQGDIAGARAQYEQAIELNPVNADARNNLGLILVNEGRLDEATEQFTAAIEGEPQNTRVRFNLAMQQIRQGQRIEPEKHLRDAIRLDPMYKDAVEQLARLLLDQGRHEDAAELYRHTLAIQPDNYDAQFNLGLTLEALNDFAGAERHYRKAIRLAPNLAPAYNNLAIILYRSKRYPEAWSAVRSYQAAGGTPHPDFLNALSTAHPPPR